MTEIDYRQPSCFRYTDIFKSKFLKMWNRCWKLKIHKLQNNLLFEIYIRNRIIIKLLFKLLTWYFETLPVFVIFSQWNSLQGNLMFLCYFFLWRYLKIKIQSRILHRRHSVSVLRHSEWIINVFAKMFMITSDNNLIIIWRLIKDFGHLINFCKWQIFRI